MRHRCLAWPRMTMPNSFLPFLIFLIGMSFGCQGQGNEKHPPLSSDTTTVANKPQGTYKGLVHQYGPYVLKQMNGVFTGETQNDSAIYHIKEAFPGILIHEREPLDYEKNISVTKNITLIEYYDTATHQLKKRLDLEKITPYNARTYKDISVGLIDYEYMEVYSLDSNCHKPKLPKPSHYYTRNWIRSISSNGYICVGFELIEMAGVSNVVGWEQTIMVLDAQGNDIMRLPIDHAVYPMLTDDNKFLYLTHNKQGSHEPFESCKEAISVYDLSNHKQVYYREFKDYQSGGFLDPQVVNREIIGLVTSAYHINPKTIYEVIIIESPLRQVKSYKFTPSEAEEYLKLKSFKELKAYLIEKPFTTTKF